MAILAVTLAPIAAPLLAATHPVLALFIRSFFSRVCHQDAARSFIIEGSPVAVCIRCLGIYCGVAVGMLLRTERTLALRWLAIAMLLNLADVAGEALHFHGSMPVMRLLLGLVLGAATGAVFFCAAPQVKQASEHSA